jgi:AraC-like DNA-binding protein
MLTLRREPHAWLLVPVASGDDVTTTKAVASLCARVAGVTIIARFQRTSSSVQNALHLGALGVTEIVTVHSDEAEGPEHPISSAARRLNLRSVTEEVVGAMPSSLPAALLPILATAVALAYRPITAAALATALGTNERTLRRQCTRRCLPSPQWIIGWARLLLVARYLQQPGTTLTNVAALLAYPTNAALGAQVRRYLRVSPSALRHSRSLEVIYRRLEDAVADQERLLTYSADRTQNYPALSLVAIKAAPPPDPERTPRQLPPQATCTDPDALASSNGSR